jgi:hypothetical protein
MAIAVQNTIKRANEERRHQSKSEQKKYNTENDLKRSQNRKALGATGVRSVFQTLRSCLQGPAGTQDFIILLTILVVQQSFAIADFVDRPLVVRFFIVNTAAALNQADRKGGYTVRLG